MQGHFQKLKDLKKIITYYFWALKLALVQKKGSMISILVMYVIIRLIPSVEVILNKIILQNVEKSEIQLSIIVSTLILLFITYITIDVGNVIYMLFYEKIRYNVSNLIFEKVLKKINHLPIKFWEDSDNVNFINRLVITSRYEVHNLISANLSFFSTIFECFIYIIIILFFAPYMVIPMLAVAFIPYLYRMDEAKESSDLEYKLENDNKNKDYLENVLVDRNHVKELRLNNTFYQIFDKWQQIYDFIFFNRKKHFIKWNRKKLFYTILSQLLNYSILITSIILLFNKLMDFSTLFFIWQSQARLNTSIGWFASIVPNSYDGVRKVEECREFIEKSLLDESQSEQSETLVKQKDLKDPVIISLRDVNFSYQNKQTVLNNINIDIKKNQVTAILGRNGSGKSTLTKLILGLYEPDSGTILYDHSFGDLSSKKQIYNIFSSSFQDYAKYDLTLRENVGFGNLSKLQQTEEITSHLKNMSCQDILQQVNHNIDMNLGKLFDLEGVELSGGQWQRLANARALFSDHMVFIFDEPTASLDPLAELDEMNKIKELIRGKTVILISHRIGFARLADEIFIMDHGKITEHGSHDELISKQGDYYNIFQSQAKWYDLEDYDEA